MNRRFTLSLLVSLVAMTSGCTRTVPVGSLDGQRCVQIGDTVYVDDGCSACKCTASNVWSCSESVCVSGTGTGGSLSQSNSIGGAPPTTTYPSFGGVPSDTSNPTSNVGGYTLIETSARGGSTASLSTRTETFGGSTSVTTVPRGGSTSVTTVPRGGSTSQGSTCCTAQAMCNDGDTRLESADSCPDNSTCYSNSICCSTVWCAKKKTTQCTPGQSQIGDCTRCYCTDSGNWACTPNECAKCTPGQSQVTECTACYCTDSGNWACSANACSECTPGQTKKADDTCNTCTCSSSGNWSCTTKTCSDLCTYGETRLADDGCNTCTCGELGWVCTTNSCNSIGCDSGKTTYNTFRSTLFSNLTYFECTKNTDCSLFVESNRCASKCGVAVSTTVNSLLASELTILANTACSQCPTVVKPTCVETGVRCVDRRCTTVTFADY